MGRLTTHILDTANGIPAADVSIRLFAIDAGRELLGSARSNSDGRTETPLLEGAAMKSGVYELEFDIGDYFAARGEGGGGTRFLDTVVVRFGVDGAGHYHVPLLASPWSYSTYRGS